VTGRGGPWIDPSLGSFKGWLPKGELFFNVGCFLRWDGL